MLTPETWLKGQRYHLNANAYGTVVFDDYWSALQKAVDEDGTLAAPGDVKTIFEPYLTQENYPLLTVTR